MISFSRVDLFKNLTIGANTYYEDSLHRPRFPAPVDEYSTPPSIGAASYTFDRVTPRKGKEFSEMELPIDVSALSGLMTPGTDPPKLICVQPLTSSTWAERYYILGWIDSVEPLAIGQRGYNSRIKWHVDYYLTGEYWRFEALRQQEASRMLYSLGPGRFKRGPASIKRPEPSEPRKWIYSAASNYRVGQAQEEWVILRYVKTYDNKTQIITCFWEANTNYTEGGVTYHPIDLLKVYAGLIEEYIGIDADTILGCWVSPIPPYSTATAPVQKVNTYYYYYMDGGMTPATIMIGPLATPFVTDDNTKTVVVDHIGAPVGTLPWGTSASYLNLTVDTGSSSCNLIMTFRQKLLESITEASVMNTVISVPLPSVPITSNAKSSYVYSGERDYDMTMRELQKEQAAVSGIAGSGTSAIGGSIAGSMGKAGGGVGAVAGLAANLIGTSINYAASTYFDVKSQEAVDKLKSNQANNVLNTAGGNAWVSAGAKWKIVTLVRDAESAAELTAEQSELGYITDTFAADCSTIVSTGGGLRIEGLEVKGAISREGREYIAALFARGVHIDILT